MQPGDLSLLKANVNRVVRIKATNGEEIVAKIQLVSMEDEDVIYDLITTTRESQYEKHDEQPAYLIRFADIDSIEPITE